MNNPHLQRARAFGFGPASAFTLLAGLVATAFAGPREDGDANLKAGRNQEAEAAYTQAIASKPDDADARVGRARARQALGDRRGATADLDEALKLAPKNAEAWRQRGLLRLAEHDVKAAIADMDQVVALAPKAPAGYASRAAAELLAKDWAAAIADYTQAIRLRPNYAAYYANRGYAWELSDDADTALLDYGEALKLDAKNTFALMHRAAIQERRGALPNAAADYRAALAADPKLTTAAERITALEQNAAFGEDIVKDRLVEEDRKGTGLLTSVPKEAAMSKKDYDAWKKQQSGGQGPTVTAAVTPDSNPQPDAPAATGGKRSTSGSHASSAAAVPAKAPPPATPKPAVVAKAEPPKPPPSAPTTPTSAPAPSAPSPDFEYLHRSNFLQIMINGSFALTTDAGDRPFVMKPGGYANLGIPISWNGDEFYFSGACPDIVRPDRKGIFWNRTDATYLVWGKIAVDGTTIQSLRVLYHRVDGSQLLLEFRDLALRNRNASPDDPTVIAPNSYSQHAANSDSDELFRSLGRIRDADRPYRGTRMVDGEQKPDPATISTLAEYRPFANNVMLYRDRDLLPVSSAETSAAVQTKLKGLFEQAKGWASIQPITDPRLAELFPQWVGQRKAAEMLEVRTAPAGRKELRADGHDSIRLQARVKPGTGEATTDTLAATKSITFTADGEGAPWLDLSKNDGELRDGWRETLVQASNPDPVRGGANKPPEKFVVRIGAQFRGRQMVQSFEIGLAAIPDIVAAPDLIEFASASGHSATVRVGIENPGPDAWHFRTEYEKGSRPLANAEVKVVDGKSALVLLTEAGVVPVPDGTYDERATLRIIAEQKDRDPLERDIKIAVSQEGLFVTSINRDPVENLYRLHGDGSAKPTEIDFRVFAADPETKKMINLARRPGALSAVKIECLEPDGTITANLLKSAQFHAEVADEIRSGNEPAGIIRMTLAKEVPWDGRIVPCDFRISYPERGEPPFSAIITVGVVTTANGPGSADWHLELDRCQEVINRFVPAAYYPKLQAMLDRRKMTLGAEGLRELRFKIWDAAVQMTLGEGGKGYASEAAWAGAITEALEWSEWAGDMAFGAVSGVWFGPYSAMGVGILKTTIISALQAYDEGRTPEEWLWQNLATIPGLLEGKIVDVQTFEQLGMTSKAKMWALFVGYHFFKNLYLEQSVVGALKKTSGTVTSTMLSTWLGEELKKNANRSVSSWASAKATEAGEAITRATQAEPAPAKAAPPPELPVAKAKPAAAEDETPATAAKANQKKSTSESEETVAKKDQRKAAADEESAPSKAAAEPNPAQEAESIALVRSRMWKDDEGNPHAHIDDVLAIMQDPSKVRALKNAPPEVQEAFARTRNSIYREHDTTVVAFVKDKVPGMKNRLVKVLEFRTPGQSEASLNTDRDYRVCYYSYNPKTGKGQWVEVDRRLWQDQSYLAFANAIGRKPQSATEAKHIAEEHQQRGTDAYDPEASRAFSDQATIWNPRTNQYDKVQVVSNVKRVEAGEKDIYGKNVDLEDPQSLGHMYQMKVGDAHHDHEAYVQANKAVTELTALRKGYNLQGRKIGQVPEKVLAGMDAVIEVNEKLKKDPNRRDPAAIAEANKKLRENGFQDLSDFMNKLSSQFESFKLMKEE